ncbi:DinB family protein [Paracraurococcus lichenis]|uniref:DinB family protein n=1 Tax=Paracraurococcus lichenis TaxID=3064888 RepID=A0ABT9DYQ2_9PROT|nr:DinB family protein [Paracraurococcus sp. LOR1-02]MDO9709011.1 DinB family protein [Paracraurococcus sp. LOR1-02]
MISPDWCRLMAAYNAEMNRRLYAAAAELPDAARRQERGAWFGSIHGTLCHLLWGDRQWMSRFAGWDPPPPGIPNSPGLIHDFDELRAARSEADARIEAWAATLTPDWLAGELTWFSGASQKQMTDRRWVLVTHLFNHQTHHRGQAHDLITQAGVRPAATDLPWILDRKALGL